MTAVGDGRAAVGADAALAYADAFLGEDDVLAAARRRAVEVGCVPVAAGTGAALRLLAAALSARAVVEIGTGTGVSGAWLLRGMRPGATLTSVDVDAEHQRLARLTFTEAGFASSRARLIRGAALDVLPRLSDGAYDLVFCDAAQQEYPDYLTEALRLLRPGGIVAFDNVWWGGKVMLPAARDPATVALRTVAERVREDEGLAPALLPLGDGLLSAVKLG